MSISEFSSGPILIIARATFTADITNYVTPLKAVI